MTWKSRSYPQGDACWVEGKKGVLPSFCLRLMGFLPITIGDNVNDEQMLKNAGLGVAMGNSAPYIQKMAKEVTLDNNSGGGAHIVEKYILN